MNAILRDRLDHSISLILSVAVNGILFLLLFSLVQRPMPPTQPAVTMVIEAPDPLVMDPLDFEVKDDGPGVESLDPHRQMENQKSIELTNDADAMDAAPPIDWVERPQLFTDNVGSLVMPGVAFLRTEPGRKAALDKYGSGQGIRSEASVIKALQWLRDRQLPTGAWNLSGNTSDTRSPSAGMTGLALLAFLAHGETPSSAEYGRTVSGAIRFLVENQDARGYFQPAGAHNVYGHAIATYAIAEAYTMTENALLREPMERGVKLILDGQQRTGGYDYDYKLSDRNDSSVGAWQIQALKAASIAGASNPNLAQLLQRGMDGMLLNSVSRQDGSRGFGYTSGGSRLSISAAGALCMQLVGRGNAQETKQTLEYIRPHVPNWANSQIKDGGGSIYFWYYAAQARFHADPEGRLFKDFNGPMVTEFSNNQNPDGSWTDPTDAKHGPVMSTALGALTLMVYYRHLPTTQHDRIRPVTQEAVRALDEDVIKFAL